MAKISEGLDLHREEGGGEGGGGGGGGLLNRTRTNEVASTVMAPIYGSEQLATWHL